MNQDFTDVFQLLAHVSVQDAYPVVAPRVERGGATSITQQLECSDLCSNLVVCLLARCWMCHLAEHSRLGD